MKPGMTLDDISEEALLECSSLVKANSIQGCKKSSVYIVYTRWKNLRKTNDMVDGQGKVMIGDWGLITFLFILVPIMNGL